jgi:hypothetical protein
LAFSSRTATTENEYRTHGPLVKKLAGLFLQVENRRRFALEFYGEGLAPRASTDDALEERIPFTMIESPH